MDHLFQFVILEGFYKDITLKKTNIYERNFKNFSGQEFHDSMRNTDWISILKLDLNDPNVSMNNLHQFINYPLKKGIKAKAKPWINIEIQLLMKKRESFYTNFPHIRIKILN